MKLLLVSHDAIGAWFLLRLISEGWDCDWVAMAPDFGHALSGLIPAPLKKLPDSVADYDLVLFDSTGYGDMAEAMRKQTPVLGDGLLNSSLEDDRMFGLEAMESCGIEVPPYEEFSSPEEARGFLEENPKRFVYKPCSPAGEEQDSATTYVSESAEDMLANLDHLFEESGHAPFILQQVVRGVEVSTEGWFDGHNFVLHNHTWEEKKFMDGGHGPNTGCSGNLVWATNGPTKLFEHGLGRMTPWLREHGYRGMVDLNAIVSPMHVYGLEFTPRLGYDASATLFALIDSPLGEFLLQVATGQPADPKISAPWAASLRLTVPPYPSYLEGQHPAQIVVKGIPLEDAWRSCFLRDIALDGDALTTAGIDGVVCCPIGCGYSPQGAWKAALEEAKKVSVPNGQKRTDLEATTITRLNSLKEMGWV